MISDNKKPGIFALIAAGLAATVVVPLSYIVGAVVTIALGTNHDVVGALAQNPYQPGILAGTLIMVLFTLYVTYATYSWNKAKYVDGTVE
jgi:hypothetical protein